jgi:hypothetical protein
LHQLINILPLPIGQRAKKSHPQNVGSSKKQLVLQFLSEPFYYPACGVCYPCIDALDIGSFCRLYSFRIAVPTAGAPHIFLCFCCSLRCRYLVSGFILLGIIRYKPVLVLKNQVLTTSGTSRNAWLRKTLTVSQFVIAQVFIMATVMVSSNSLLAHQRPGL